MAEGSNTKKFTASDIERYHHGLLSSKEKNELEKAALDDPFLADALEGYAAAGVNAADDISDLQKRLEERINKEKIIPVGKRSAKFFWLRVAAIVILAAGAGILIYQFGFNNKEKNVAQNISTKKAESAKDSNPLTTLTPQKKADSSVKVETNKTDAAFKNESAVAPNKKIIVSAGKSNSASDSISVTSGLTPKSDKVLTPDKSSSVSNGYTLTAPEKKEIKNNQPVIIQKDHITANNVTTLDEVVANKKMPEKNQNESLYKAKQKDINNLWNSYQVHNNIFHGRVMDENNNPLPFANITNISDSVGTYADAKGYFNLVSPDSILNVQIRSVGFDNATVQLKYGALNNNIVLQENKNADAVILSHKKFNADSSRMALFKIDEPEPNDGWGTYDLYLTNNLKMPDEAITKQLKGEVEVSFDVDKNGQPVNMKIERSLCNECDKEAMRVIKEGPKWKRKAKKGRATVTVSF